MELVIFLLYNNLFINQVLCKLVYRRCSFYSFLQEMVEDTSTHMSSKKYHSFSTTVATVLLYVFFYESVYENLQDVI